MPILQTLYGGMSTRIHVPAHEALFAIRDVVHASNGFSFNERLESVKTLYTTLKATISQAAFIRVMLGVTRFPKSKHKLITPHSDCNGVYSLYTITQEAKLFAGKPVEVCKIFKDLKDDEKKKDA